MKLECYYLSDLSHMIWRECGPDGWWGFRAEQLLTTRGAQSSIQVSPPLTPAPDPSPHLTPLIQHTATRTQPHRKGCTAHSTVRTAHTEGWPCSNGSCCCCMSWCSSTPPASWHRCARVSAADTAATAPVSPAAVRAALLAAGTARVSEILSHAVLCAVCCVPCDAFPPLSTGAAAALLGEAAGCRRLLLWAAAVQLQRAAAGRRAAVRWVGRGAGGQSACCQVVRQA